MSTPSLATTSVSTESVCAPSDTNIGWVVDPYGTLHNHQLFSYYVEDTVLTRGSESSPV